jgi:hypothetical protein
MLRRVSSFAVMVGIAIVLGGCAAFQPGLDNQTLQPNQPLTLDDKFVQIARSVPSFGGMFFDNQQNLNIYLTDQMQIASAQSEIASVLGISVPQANVRVLRGEHNFIELKRWHDRAIGLFDIEGVLSTDIDETQNRLKIGVAQADQIGLVEQQIAQLRIPASAVEVVVTEPIVPMATLRDQVRPLVGGLQINFPGYLCTYGFNAVRAGVNGFVTNSHCTTTQGGVESTPYYQPTQAISPTQIGTEIADPTYNKSTCPSSIRGKKCRYSDSSFARHENSVAADFGRIAKIDTPNTGSLNIVGNYRIVAESSAVVGQTVNKVGRTTGWGQGAVTSTCVNVGVLGSSIVQLCQDQVTNNSAVIVDSGDSGSPVFRITNSPNADDVQLYGILWGGSTSGNLFVYSPIANVQLSSTELGALTVCASGFSC